MDVNRQVDPAVATVAAAIGEPSRARMLYCLMDGHARTSTELAVVANVSASTASAHLSRLYSTRLIKLVAQGRHRYYSLGGADVARMLEALNVFAERDRNKFVPSTPDPLRTARTCYDHLAGSIAVQLHDRLHSMRWLSEDTQDAGNTYAVTKTGNEGFAALGIDIESTCALRRRLAYGCLDWSERRMHIGGAIGAALLSAMQKKKWMTRNLDGRALRISALGRRELLSRFTIDIE